MYIHAHIHTDIHSLRRSAQFIQCDGHACTHTHTPTHIHTERMFNTYTHRTHAYILMERMCIYTRNACVYTHGTHVYYIYTRCASFYTHRTHVYASLFKLSMFTHAPTHALTHIHTKRMSVALAQKLSSKVVVHARTRIHTHAKHNFSKALQHT